MDWNHKPRPPIPAIMSAVDAAAASAAAVAAAATPLPPHQDDVEYWVAALQQPVCEQNNGAPAPAGCVSSGDPAAVVVSQFHIDETSPDAPPLEDEICRIAFCPSIIFNLNRADAIVNGAQLSIFTAQSYIGPRFNIDQWGSRENYANFEYRVAQPVGGHETNSTTIAVFPNNESGRVVYEGEFNAALGNKTGVVSITNVVDPRLPNHEGGVRLCVIVVPSINYPERGGAHDRDHGVCGLDVMDERQGDHLRLEIKKKVYREVVLAVEKCRAHRANVLVAVANPLLVADPLLGGSGDVNMERYLTSQGLRTASWEGYRFFMSPGLPHQIRQVTLCVGGGVIVDLWEERLRNASGVCCCVSRDPRRYGYGAPAPGAIMTHRVEQHDVVDGDILGYIRRLGGEDYLRLTFPEDNVELIMPGGDDRPEIERAINELSSHSVWMFDSEFYQKRLGMLAFLRRTEGGELVAVLLRKQILGDMFTEVLPRLKPVLESVRLVTFDKRQDVKVLKSEEINMGDNALDLREAMSAVFPLVFAHVEPNGSLTTQLGLSHFVEMVAGRRLDKELQVSQWTSESIQADQRHIEYALCDVFAILLVYEYYVR